METKPAAKKDVKAAEKSASESESSSSSSEESESESEEEAKAVVTKKDEKEVKKVMYIIYSMRVIFNVKKH